VTSDLVETDAHAMGGGAQTHALDEAEPGDLAALAGPGIAMADDEGEDG
jgi:hypothetical protein